MLTPTRTILRLHNRLASAESSRRRILADREASILTAREADLLLAEVDSKIAELRKEIANAAPVLGRAAIEVHRATASTTRLDKYADTIESARQGLTIAEAEAVVVEDPNLVYLTTL